MMTEISQCSKIKFYTTGFARQDINALKPMLTALDAVLVDVRLFPVSELMRWRQIYLKSLLRERYRHIAQLGSRRDRFGNIQIQHLDLGIKILFSFQANAVLMCECFDFVECHRVIIAKELERRNFEVEELGDWRSFVTG